MTHPPPKSTLFPYTTLFRSPRYGAAALRIAQRGATQVPEILRDDPGRRAGRRNTAMSSYKIILEVSRVLRRTLWERSEEHTSELQSHSDLVCRLLLEKKKKK